MAKKGNRLVYGEKEPTSINELNGPYIKAYLSAKLADGSISKNQIAGYMKKKDAELKKKYNEVNEGKAKEEKRDLTPIEKSQVARRTFAEEFMPNLVPQKVEKFDLDAELEALINS